MSGINDRLERRAETLLREGRRGEAIAAYRKLLAAAPQRPDAWYNLGYLLKAEGEFEGALEAYGQALARGIRGPEEVRLNRAVIYADHLRRDEDAERELRAALAQAPAYLPALLNLGNLLEERGQREEALATYERAVALPAASPASQRLRSEALARIAHLRPPAGPGDPMLAQLEAQGADARLDPVTRANVLFALGRACDALGLHERAFTAFAAANHQSGRTAPPYSRQQARNFTDALVAAFPAAVPGRPQDAPDRPAPLFICGMFRSGSTLVEQVLASHPAVLAGGELDWLPRRVRGPLAPFPASARTLDDRAMSALAGEYQDHLWRLFPAAGPGIRYLTDKRPDNYQLLGLIKRMFPAARIIHTTRHPLDTGLSVYMQHLDPRATSYASDLGAIGHHYGEYRRLMAHWRQLYGDSILDFDYDAFVREPRPALARLLAFLELEWHEGCLAFHELDNTVKTASYWQVRRPLYAEASGRWRNYRAQLAPLAAALREAGLPEDELR